MLDYTRHSVECIELLDWILDATRWLETKFRCRFIEILPGRLVLMTLVFVINIVWSPRGIVMMAVPPEQP